MRARKSTNSDITTFESTQADSTLTTFDGPDFGSAKPVAQVDGDLTTFTSQYHHTDVTESVGFGRADQGEPLTTFESEESVQYKPAFGRQTGGMSSLTTFESDSMSYNPELSFGQRARNVDSLTTFDSDSTVSRRSKSSFGKQTKPMQSLTTFDSDTHGDTALTTFDVAPNQINNDTLTSWATDTNNLHL
jgi:hypothetical protein